jgi:hypothetical protein
MKEIRKNLRMARLQAENQNQDLQNVKGDY